MSLSVLFFSIALLLILTVLLFGMYVVRNMFMPTRGKRIAAYSRPAKALLVLDIQESNVNRQSAMPPPPTTTPFGSMIEKVNHLISCFTETGQEVAYIRQVFSSNLITRLHGGRIVPGRMEPRICRWVKIVNSNDFAKNRTDAFSSRHLERFLIERQVNEVFLVGLDAAFCVYFTALGALNRGYRVTVVTDAVMTGRDMDTVLRRYHKKGIAVTGSQELIKSLHNPLDISVKADIISRASQTRS